MLTAKTTKNLKISHNSPPDSRPVCFTVGLSDFFGFIKPPSPCLVQPLIVSDILLTILSSRLRIVYFRGRTIASEASVLIRENAY